MENYVIFTDTAADLTSEQILDWNVKVAHLKYTVNDITYDNKPTGTSMSLKEFYDSLRKGGHASTTLASIEEYREGFEEVLEQDKDILYIGISSALSGTINSARNAIKELSGKYPDRKIIIVDTLAASAGEGLLVYHAVQKQKQGFTLEQNVHFLEYTKSHLAHWFIVDNLFHLKKGGRISATSAVFGTMLGIKPVLHVNDEGKLEPVQKVRGKKAALEFMLKKMKETADPKDEQTVFISHADSADDAEYLAKLIKKSFNIKNISINFIGPSIGVHSGPGAVALFFLAKCR